MSSPFLIQGLIESIRENIFFESEDTGSKIKVRVRTFTEKNKRYASIWNV